MSSNFLLPLTQKSMQSNKIVPDDQKSRTLIHLCHFMHNSNQYRLFIS